MQYSPFNNDLSTLLLFAKQFRYENYWEGDPNHPEDDKPGAVIRLWKWLRNRFAAKPAAKRDTAPASFENITPLPSDKPVPAAPDSDNVSSGSPREIAKKAV